MIDPMTVNLVMLGLVEAAKFALSLSEQVGKGEITPEEAKAMWKAQSTSFNETADTWFNTPPGISAGQ